MVVLKKGWKYRVYNSMHTLQQGPLATKNKVVSKNWDYETEASWKIL